MNAITRQKPPVAAKSNTVRAFAARQNFTSSARPQVAHKSQTVRQAQDNIAEEERQRVAREDQEKNDEKDRMDVDFCRTRFKNDPAIYSANCICSKLNAFGSGHYFKCMERYGLNMKNDDIPYLKTLPTE
jgi:hypothetical protein